MANKVLFFVLACALALFVSANPVALEKHYKFEIKNASFRRLCSDQVKVVVNRMFPGPTIIATEGDTLVVDVLNNSPYDMTIHWHGVFHMQSQWADGASMITQCPIRPGQMFTYKFQVVNQEGTLWWHAHSQSLRETVYGALIIKPRFGVYPFLIRPYAEIPILIGQWWNGNIVNITNEADRTGVAPSLSDAYTINGLPGHLFPCSANQIFKLNVTRGKTYMLRIINAALDNQHFFKIANHTMKVVAVDATYTTPYVTDVVVTAPGQTVDVLLYANQPIGSYYMAATPYANAAGVPFDNSTATGVIVYDGANTNTKAIMPLMPAFNDIPTAHKFYTNLTGLRFSPHWAPVPRNVDERIFTTIGFALEACPPTATCNGIAGTRFSASMNNISFVLPTKTSLLQTFYDNEVGKTDLPNDSGVSQTDFPNEPPLKFDYTNPKANSDLSMFFSPKSTSVKRLKYNSVVEIVFQNTAFVALESHPMHLHGYNFHVLGQGFGNYNSTNDRGKLNTFNPQVRNTIAVPVGGWAVIRFKANNPGVWMLHCHLDAHLPWGLATVLVVDNGPTSSSAVVRPPLDLPQC